MNNISPLAFVHPEAKLGDNNQIGPFCYIDKNVEIGDNNTFLNGVTVHYGARIGNNNEFFPGASISTKPQDLKFRGEDTLCCVGDKTASVRMSHSRAVLHQRARLLSAATIYLWRVCTSVMTAFLETVLLSATQQNLQVKLWLMTMPLFRQVYCAISSAILVVM